MMNQKYWEDRMVQNLLMSERSVLEFEKQLQDAYALALVEINKDIQSFFAKYEVDNHVPYSEAMKRLNASELKEFHVLLREWKRIAQELGLDKSYINYLTTLGERVRLSRLVSLQTSVQHQIELLKNKQYIQMTDLLTTNYEASYYMNYFAIAKGMETAVSFEQIDRKAIEQTINTKWNGRNYSDSIWADRDKLVQVLNKTIPQAFSRGLSIKQMADEISSITNTSLNHAKTLARTEVNYIANQTDLKIYKQIGIEEYQYLATLDSRTTEICRELDGKIFPVSKAQVGINYPPNHVCCRSTTTVPVDMSVGERVARNQEGQTIRVPRSMTQQEYIDTYVPESKRDWLQAFVKQYSKA